MILAEIKSKSELNIINSDAIVINIAHFSSPSDSLISINEAKEIIKESTKPWWWILVFKGCLSKPEGEFYLICNKRRKCYFLLYSTATQKSFPTYQT